MRAIRLLGKQPLDAVADETVLSIYLACQAMDPHGPDVFAEPLSDLRRPEAAASYQRQTEKFAAARAERSPRDAASGRAALRAIVSAAVARVEALREDLAAAEAAGLSEVSAHLSYRDKETVDWLWKHQARCSRSLCRTFEELRKVRRDFGDDLPAPPVPPSDFRGLSLGSELVEGSDLPATGAEPTAVEPAGNHDARDVSAEAIALIESVSATNDHGPQTMDRTNEAIAPPDPLPVPTEQGPQTTDRTNEATAPPDPPPVPTGHGPRTTDPKIEASAPAEPSPVTTDHGPRTTGPKIEAIAPIESPPVPSTDNGLRTKDYWLFSTIVAAALGIWVPARATAPRTFPAQQATRVSGEFRDLSWYDWLQWILSSSPIHSDRARLENLNRRRSTTDCMEVIMRCMPGMVVVSCLMVTAGWAAIQEDERESAGPAVDGRSSGGVPVQLASYQRGRASGGFMIRWIGQDGQDHVGPSNRLEASDVQDIHLSLGGLDPRRKVVFVDVTGEGGDQWQYNAQSFAWKAELKRKDGSTTAELYLEPARVETGRNFHISVRYEDGTTVEADVRSRKTNPNLRMPGVALQAQWLGQDRHDMVGPGASVGPDGLQDARIRLSGLGVKVPIRAIRIDGADGMHWESGSNPRLLPNAELIRDPKDPSKGDLAFQPERDLAGQRLKLTVLYENEKRDATTVTATRLNPALRMPLAPPPKIEQRNLTAKWLGQDGVGKTRLGDVHVVLSGLSATSRLAAVVLNDSVRGLWVYRATDRPVVPPDPMYEPMDVKIGDDRTSLELFFPPHRDGKGDTFTVRFINTDGRMSYAQFPGGSCDVARRSPAPDPSRIEARPGDDLQALADRYGTIVLSRGTYRLSHALILNRPVTLTSDGGATIVFAQDKTDPPWRAAIKVRCGNTTLNGFAVRFEGTVRWNTEVSYGPAIIGMADNFDPGYDEQKFNVVFTKLDVENPAVENPGTWSEAIRLLRLCHAQFRRDCRQRPARGTDRILRRALADRGQHVSRDGPGHVLARVLDRS